MLSALASFIIIAPAPPLPHYQPTDTKILARVILDQAYTEYPRDTFSRWKAQELAESFVASGAAWGIDPAYLAAASWSESRWRRGAVGDVGKSRGIFQFGRWAARVTRYSWWPDLNNIWLASWSAGAYFHRVYSRKKTHHRWVAAVGCGNRCNRRTVTKAGMYKIRLAYKLRAKHDWRWWLARFGWETFRDA